MHEQFHFPCVIPMREHAHVAAHRECDPGRARRFDARSLLLYPFRLGIDASLPTAILRDRVADRDRWAKRDTMFFHQLENFRGAFVAMLDRVDASQDRAAHPFGRRRVRRDETTRIVRGLYRGSYFLQRKCRTRWLAGAPAIIDVELYPICPFADLFARNTDK